MHNHANSSPLLALEETLFILEECLQGDNSLLLDSPIVSDHIQTLKSCYSPEFDFDFSETGSYFFAALSAIDRCYIGANTLYKLPLSEKFTKSLHHLLHISRLSINYRSYNQTIVDHLLSLANLWNLQHAMDMRVLILQTLSLMRLEIKELNVAQAEDQHGK